MNHTRVRTDKFTSASSALRVTGRQGYESSTDIWIARDMETKFEQKTEDTEDLGWNVLRSPYGIPHTYTHINLNGKVSLDLARGLINDSLEHVKIRPVGSHTPYNAYPKTQQKLLPYLIPYDTFGRQDPFRKTTQDVEFGVNNETGVVPDQHWWDPTVNGEFVYGFHANATTAGNANSIPLRGYCPRHMIQFGRFQAPHGGQPGGNDVNGIPFFQPFSPNTHLIPLSYNKTHDQLSFNNYNNLKVIVRVDTRVLLGAQNNNNAHFFELNHTAVQAAEYLNDLWQARFDENGIAGRVPQHDLPVPAAPAVVNAPGNKPNPVTAAWLDANAAYETYQTEFAAYYQALVAFNEAENWFGIKTGAAWPNDNSKYTYDAANFNEFYPITLWTPGQPGKFVQGGVAIPQIANAYPTFRLFLRRPRFSKGNAYNWVSNPALSRFYSWYDKEISTINPVQGVFNRFPGPTPFIDLARQNAPKTRVKLGFWGVIWAGATQGQLPVAPHTFHNTERYIEEWVILIDDPAVWAAIQGKTPTEETCLLLETGRRVVKQANNQHHNLPVQYIGRTRFYVRFQTRHATFVQGQGINQILFNRTALLAAGAGNWGHGVPQTLGDGDRIYADHVLPFTGWIEDDAPGQPLKAVLKAEGDATTNPQQPNGFFDYQGTESPADWATGRRPMFSQNNQFARHFKSDMQLSDTNVAGTPDELWKGLNSMFKGNVYTNVPTLTDRRTVHSGRAKHTVQLKEPLFGMDSGYSTYRVNHIFKPKAWNNILLQDIDYQFTPAQATSRNLKLNSELEYELTAERDIVDENGQVHRQSISFPVPMTLDMKDATSTSLIIRSRDGLDQRTKLLESVSQPYPLIQQHKTHVTGAPNPETRVSIYTEHSVPDYFFIYAERNYPTDAAYVAKNNPIVVGLEIYGRTNKSKALSSYLKDKHEIWQCTLRNSHPLSDDDRLLEGGGVLISKEDVGTLERDQFSSRDNFDYDLRILLENEDGGSQETDAQKAARIQYPMTLHVCCIYLDKLLLKGSTTKLSFVEVKK